MSHLSTEQLSPKAQPDDCTITIQIRLHGYLPAASIDVYFERTTAEFSSDAIARSTAAKLKLESYYKVAVDAAIERNARSFHMMLVCPYLKLNADF